MQENINLKINFIFQLEHQYLKDARLINSLKRCTRCILPETMPYIQFNKEGVCNYCLGYKKVKLKGRDELEKQLKQHRSSSGQPDCLAMFSGGRDSSYALHCLKKIFKMNPIAYSYDWGMLTDLAHRNQTRMCSQLGIKHILITADIGKKIENIRKNVLAWLKKPDLGTVPLFMAGDKQYYYYANKLSKQMGINLMIESSNPLEKTGFKYGFSRVNLNLNRKSGTTRDLSSLSKVQLAKYYAQQYLSNPAYLNSSLMDTLFAYLSYYFIPHDYLRLFNYLEWNEQEVESVLINQYGWETSEDTSTTWRIGDGTAAFYNYIYYILAGFTENDTFRSNQIREGVISRQEALERSRQENQPRFESIKWYCATIKIDFEKTIKRINSIPKLYEDSFSH